MKFLNRITAFALSAAMLLSPAAVLAEEADYGFSAGDLTKTAVEESYTGGEQLNLTAAFGLSVDESVANEKLQAIATLLEKSTVTMSFYDDFGTARIHAQLDTDGVNLVTADALIYEDGSVQVMTSLTGKYVLSLPEGTYVDGQISLPVSDEVLNANIDDPESFSKLPAVDRLKISSNYVGSTILNLLLGWVSSTQMETGELYTFDDTPVDATDARDAVAQRMVGKISTWDFTTFIWNVVATLRDEHGEWLQAIADCLAEAGVTRVQAHEFADAMFTDEEIDPATDFVQTSWAVRDDHSPIQLNDVQYFFRKMEKSVDKISCESTGDDMAMIVSYDEDGVMVGFDADIPSISTLLPYEGDFTYSIKTDEDAQRLHTSHGELQVYNDNRVIGDLAIKFGQDIGGTKDSGVSGVLYVQNQADASSIGVGVDGGVTWQIGEGENGEETEAFGASAVLILYQDGETLPMVTGSVSGETALGESTLVVDAVAEVNLAGMASAFADVTLEQVEYEDIVFAGGEAIDLFAITDEQMESLKSEVVSAGTKIAMGLITKAGVMNALLTLVGE